MEIGYGMFRRRLGTIVWVSNPVAQRLTVFSEDASVSKTFFRRAE